MRDGRNSGLVEVAKKLLESHGRGQVKLTANDVANARDTIAKGQSGKVRTASELLIALGDPECPPEYPPSPELFRECRWALGMTQKKLAWELGSSGRTGQTVASIERGDRRANRSHRLLLRVLLRKLESAQLAKRL